MIENKKIALSVLDTAPKFDWDYEEAVYGADSIVMFGKDNQAPRVFRDCYTNSATLKSIIDGTVNYVLGDAIEVSVENFKDSVNRRGMTMRQFLASISLSYLIYGGFVFQVIYNKLGVVTELYPLDFGRCRTNESGSHIWYSKRNWGKYTTKADKYDRFDMGRIDPKNPTQIFYYKGDFTTNVYPLPPYYAALRDVLTEIECSKYSLNSVTNGFSARYILNFPDVGNLTDEQKADIETAIKEKFCGTDTSSNFMLYWKDGEEGMEVSKIETDNAVESFINVKDNARTNIFISMRATPLLFGLPNASNGFSTNEYSDSFKLFQKNVIVPIQDIMKESLSKVLGDDAITITPYTIEFGGQE